MAGITFWKDRATRKIDPALFSVKAEELALTLAKEGSGKRVNKRTQIRKFYDEVLRLDAEVKARPENWDNLIPHVHMLVAKAAYAYGRALVSETFLNFIKESVKQVSEKDDLRVFANFFEAFMGFYRQHGPAN